MIALLVSITGGLGDLFAASRLFTTTFRAIDSCCTVVLEWRSAHQGTNEDLTSLFPDAIVLTADSHCSLGDALDGCELIVEYPVPWLPIDCDSWTTRAGNKIPVLRIREFGNSYFCSLLGNARNVSAGLGTDELGLFDIVPLTPTPDDTCTFPFLASNPTTPFVMCYTWTRKHYYECARLVLWKILERAAEAVLRGDPTLSPPPINLAAYLPWDSGARRMMLQALQALPGVCASIACASNGGPAPSVVGASQAEGGSDRDDDTPVDGCTCAGHITIGIAAAAYNQATSVMDSDCHECDPAEIAVEAPDACPPAPGKCPPPTVSVLVHVSPLGGSEHRLTGREFRIRMQEAAGVVVCGDMSFNEALCAGTPWWYSPSGHKQQLATDIKDRVQDFERIDERNTEKSTDRGIERGAETGAPRDTHDDGHGSTQGGCITNWWRFISCRCLLVSPKAAPHPTSSDRAAVPSGMCAPCQAVITDLAHGGQTTGEKAMRASSSRFCDHLRRAGCLNLADAVLARIREIQGSG